MSDLRSRHVSSIFQLANQLGQALGLDGTEVLKLLFDYAIDKQKGAEATAKSAVRHQRDEATKRGRGRPKGARSTYGAVNELAAQLLDEIEAAGRDGLTAEQMQTPVKDRFARMAALRKLRSQGKLKTQGNRRGMRYFAIDVDSGATEVPARRRKRG